MSKLSIERDFRLVFHLDCAQFSAQTQAGKHATGHKNLPKTSRRNALFLSDSAESNSNPMSSFAILCSGITLCPQASELGQSTKIISVASYFTCCILIVFRVNTGDQSTGEIRIYRHNGINAGLGLSHWNVIFISQHYLIGPTVRWWWMKVEIL